MSDSETLTPDDERKAHEFCLKLLREAPDVDYKEARREGRSEGVKVTRAIFSAAQREAGARRPPRRRPAPGPQGGGPPRHGGPRPPHPRDRDDRPRRDDRPPRRDAGPARREDHPPRRDDRPPHREDRRPDHDPHREAAAREPRPAPRRDDGAARPPVNSLVAPQLPGAGAPEAPPAPLTPETLFGVTPDFTEDDVSNMTPVEFMVEQLKKRPEISFKEMRDLAESKGFTIYPATFGRAQSQAGLLDNDDEPEAPAPARKPKASKARPPIDPKDPAAALENLVDDFAALTQSRDDVRAALQKMLDVVQKALASGQSELPPLEIPEGLLPPPPPES